MDKCREDFELFFVELKQKEKFDADLSKTNGNYNYQRTAHMWQGWQAKHERINTIKLPDYLTLIDCDYDNGYMDAMERCKAAITSAGYKVEE